MASVSNQEGERAMAHIFGFSVDLLNNLGHGGFGTVYKGFNKDQRIVALKKVSLAFKPHEEEIISKAKVLLLLDGYDEHTEGRDSEEYTLGKEHIITTREVRSYKKSMWIVMEYCDLGNLNCFFDKMRTPMKNEQTKIRIMIQIMRGLAFLHSKDIVHRDIKPGNILVKSESNNRVVIKLGDFGLSKILDPEGFSSVMSSDASCLSFKAPEFWNKRIPDYSERYNRNVDVYAAGLTFTAMIQARPGRNLVPKAEGNLQYYETKMPIGLAVFSRVSKNLNAAKESATINVRSSYIGFEVVVDDNKDEEIIRKMKSLIREMLQPDPRDRPSALEIEIKLRMLVRITFILWQNLSWSTKNCLYQADEVHLSCYHNFIILLYFILLNWSN